MIPAIVLAGGLGTRLRSVVPDLPKPMASVAGKPFLWWLLQRLEQQGVRDIYLSVGYRRESIEAYFGDTFGVARLHYVAEERPLGTGGAIVNAMSKIDTDAVLVLNGDTMAVVELPLLCEAADAGEADIVIAVAPLDDTARYGAVEYEPTRERAVRAFREKGAIGPGHINAGIYWLRCASLAQQALPVPFSFEQDFLCQRLADLRIHALPSVRHFIDIGVPDDYQLAQSAVPWMTSLP